MINHPLYTGLVKSAERGMTIGPAVTDPTPPLRDFLRNHPEASELAIPNSVEPYSIGSPLMNNPALVKLRQQQDAQQARSAMDAVDPYLSTPMKNPAPGERFDRNIWGPTLAKTEPQEVELPEWARQAGYGAIGAGAGGLLGTLLGSIGSSDTEEERKSKAKRRRVLQLLGVLAGAGGGLYMANQGAEPAAA